MILKRTWYDLLLAFDHCDSVSTSMARAFSEKLWVLIPEPKDRFKDIIKQLRENIRTYFKSSWNRDIWKV